MYRQATNLIAVSFSKGHRYHMVLDCCMLSVQFYRMVISNYNKDCAIANTHIVFLFSFICVIFCILLLVLIKDAEWDVIWFWAHYKRVEKLVSIQKNVMSRKVICGTPSIAKKKQCNSINSHATCYIGFAPHFFILILFIISEIIAFVRWDQSERK